MEYSISWPGVTVVVEVAGTPLMVTKDMTPSGSGMYASTAIAAIKIT